VNWFTKSAVVVVVACAALLGGYFFQAWISPPEERTPDAAAALFAATLNDLEGRPQAISQWRGKVVVVNFWATWCPPCIKEIPELVRVQERMGAEGVQVVGIAIDDKARVAEFARKVPMNYPSLIAEVEGLTLSRQAGNRLGGLPFTVIIDRQGRAARIELGAVDEKKLEPILRELL
jgi:thiol-disulfide isomerase/thioredoxin